MTKEQATTLAAMMRKKYPVLAPQALPFANTDHGYFVSFRLYDGLWLFEDYDDGVRYVQQERV